VCLERDDLVQPRVWDGLPLWKSDFDPHSILKNENRWPAIVLRSNAVCIADRRTIALGPHSKGWTGGRVDALLGVEGATVGASVWLRGAGGLSLTCELGPATADLCASWVALDRLERAVNGLVR